MVLKELESRRMKSRFMIRQQTNTESKLNDSISKDNKATQVERALCSCIKQYWINSAQYESGALHLVKTRQIL